MDDVVTTSTIINRMRDWVENRKPIPPSTWLDAAASLNVLRSDLDDELYTLEHNLAVDKASIMVDPDVTAAKANIFIEAREEYMKAKKLRAKIKQVEEFIRIAKKQSTLKDNQWNDA